jgi:Flp pilus assembly protein TadG
MTPVDDHQGGNHQGGNRRAICRRPSAASGRRGLFRDDSGAAAIEMAFVALPLLLFIFTIINTGRVLWLQNALENSVMQAARCATVNSALCGTANQITTYAAAQSGAGFTSGVFSYAQAGCGNRVSASYPLTLPLMHLSLTLSAQACFPINPA